MKQAKNVRLNAGDAMTVSYVVTVTDSLGKPHKINMVIDLKLVKIEGSAATIDVVLDSKENLHARRKGVE